MRQCRMAMLLILGLAFALRVGGLASQELRGDEVFGFFLAVKPYGQIVRHTLQLGEPHPVASYWLLHAWIQVAGDSEFALRFPSAWAGALAAALLYRLGRELRYPRRVATLAVLLLAVNPYQIWHSQDARMYTESLVLNLAASWILWKAWMQDSLYRTWWLWLIYSLFMVLSLHVHYYGVFVLAFHWMFMLRAVAGIVWPRLQFQNRHWRVPRKWWLAQVIIGLGVGPWFWSVQDVLGHYHGNGDSPRFLEMAQRSLVAFTAGEMVPPALTQWVILTTGVFLLVGLVRSSQEAPARAWFLTLYLVLPIGGIWLAALNRPIFNERYLVAASPPLYLLIAAGMNNLDTRLRSRKLTDATGLAVVASIALMALWTAATLASLVNYYTQPVYGKTRGWRRLAAALDQAAPNDRIVQNFPDPTLWYYYRGTTPHLTLPPAPYDYAGTDQFLSELASLEGLLWFIPQLASNWDSEGYVERELQRHFELRRIQQLGVFRLEIYAPPQVYNREKTRAMAQFGSCIQLTGYSLRTAAGAAVSAVRPGDHIAVTLFWEPMSTPESRYTVFVHLIGPDGAIYGQHDGQPVSGTYPTVQWRVGKPVVDIHQLTVAAHAPPGMYALAVGLYSSSSGERLPITAASHPVDQNRLFLAKVLVRL